MTPLKRRQCLELKLNFALVQSGEVPNPFVNSQRFIDRRVPHFNGRDDQSSKCPHRVIMC
jgi:hypothetical protein